uniref:Uncharacterized protein n=1 Tax=Amphimedon queenslandica TaxID=400682 RepID=A0A1X7V599_AMPQE
MSVQLLLLALLSVSVKGQLWIQVQGAGPAMHSVHANSEFLWGIDTLNYAQYCKRPCSSKWEYRTHNIRNLDVGTDFTYFVSFDYKLYRGTAKESNYEIANEEIGTTDVAAGGNGYIWFLDADNNIRKWSTSLESVESSIDGRFINIAANSEYVFGIDYSNTINYRPIFGGEGPWETIPGQFKCMTAGAREIFAVGYNNTQIFRCTIPCIGNWEKMESPASNVVQLDATVDALFAVTGAGIIYRHDLPLM